MGDLTVEERYKTESPIDRYFAGLRRGKLTDRSRHRRAVVWILLRRHTDGGLRRARRDMVFPEFRERIRRVPGEALKSEKSIETTFDTIIGEMETARLIDSKIEPLPNPEGPGTTLRTYYTITIPARFMKKTYIPQEQLSEAFDELQQAYGELFDEVIDLRGFIFSRGLKEEYRNYLRSFGKELPKRPGDYLALKYIEREG